MKKGSAWAPANISLIFSIYEHEDPRWKGSYGLGFTINEGVTVTVEKASKYEIKFNERKIDFPTVHTVVKKLTDEPISVCISTKLPLGCGFGLSGASALATAYALNSLLELGKTNKELAILAHIAEVENGTGLGDVVNQYYGGFFIKTKPSSEFKVQRLSIIDIPVYLRWYGSKSTSAVLNDISIGKQINNVGMKAISEVEKIVEKGPAQLSAMLSVSREFVLESGLLTDKKVQKTIEEVEKNGGNASMVMIGNTVVSTIPFEGSLKFHISDQKAYILV